MDRHYDIRVVTQADLATGSCTDLPSSTLETRVGWTCWPVGGSGIGSQVRTQAQTGEAAPAKPAVQYGEIIYQTGRESSACIAATYPAAPH